jgi:hypothetical protein
MRFRWIFAAKPRAAADRRRRHCRITVNEAPNAPGGSHVSRTGSRALHDFKTTSPIGPAR